MAGTFRGHRATKTVEPKPSTTAKDRAADEGYMGAHAPSTIDALLDDPASSSRYGGRYDSDPTANERRLDVLMNPPRPKRAKSQQSFGATSLAAALPDLD